MIVTQSCDIERSSKERPFLELAPLEVAEPGKLAEIRKGRHARYVYVPGVFDKGLVADLERVMTVEKAAVQGWERVRGCRDNLEVRELSEALARKRNRFAFPDDFCALARSFNDWIRTKSRLKTPEGRAFEEIEEIRVSAEPDWEAIEVSLFFYFIRGSGSDAKENEANEKNLGNWLRFFPKNGRFTTVQGIITTLEDMTARDFVISARYDLDTVSPKPK